MLFKGGGGLYFESINFYLYTTESISDWRYAALSYKVDILEQATLTFCKYCERLLAMV